MVLNKVGIMWKTFQIMLVGLTLFFIPFMSYGAWLMEVLTQTLFIVSVFYTFTLSKQKLQDKVKQARETSFNTI